MDEKRLNYEIWEMQKVFPNARLFKDDDGVLYWELIHRGYTINIFYISEYPFTPARIYISPALRTHHHSEDLSVCWQKGGEWNPSWTATTVMGKAIQFISEFKGRRRQDDVF
jgi:ubiquitin-protein ligase